MSAPRIEFYGDEHSMDLNEAVERFRTMLTDYADQSSGMTSWQFNIDIDIQHKEKKHGN